MSNVLQILSNNYSGESVNIIFTPLTGNVQTFNNVTLPYNFINETFDGNYVLFFPEYNLTHKFVIPNPGPTQSKCRCTQFYCFSFLGSPCVVKYLTCRGQKRRVNMVSGQNFRDCVQVNSYDDKIKNVTVNLFGDCNSINDCNSLVEVTPTVTPTPTTTPINNNIPPCSKKILIVRSVEAGVCSPYGWCEEFGFQIWRYDASTLSKTLISYIEHENTQTETYDITYFYNTETETGKVWVLLFSHATNQNIIKEYNIIDSNLTLGSESRTILISDYTVGKSLEYYDSNHLISTRKESWENVYPDLNFILININNEGNITITPQIINNLSIPINTSLNSDPTGDLVKTNYNTIIYPRRGYVPSAGDINNLWEINILNGNITYIGYSALSNVNDKISSLFQYNNGLYAITEGGYGTNYGKVLKYSLNLGNTNIWTTVYDTFDFGQIKGSSSNPYCTTGTTNILQSN